MLAGVFQRGDGIVQGTGPDDDQQARIVAVEYSADGVAVVADARDAAEGAREAAAARTADPETGPLPAVEVVRPINGGPGRP